MDGFQSVRARRGYLLIYQSGRPLDPSRLAIKRNYLWRLQHAGLARATADGAVAGLFKYFDNEWTLGFAISEIKKNSRRFAKRQLTWYRKNEDVKWFDFQTPEKEIINYLEGKMKKPT